MNKAQCWHNAAVSLSAGVAAVLSQSEKDENCLCISLVPLEELSERTLELIGTNVNGNPYGKSLPGSVDFMSITCTYLTTLP